MAEEQGQDKKQEQGAMKDNKLIANCPRCDNRFWIPGATFEPKMDPMQGRILQPEKLGELTAALATARAQFKPITFNQSVNVKMDAGGSYSFQFADLAMILAATVDALDANGLAIIQEAQFWGEEMPYLETILSHKSGCAIISRMRLPDYTANKGGNLNKTLQSLGSALTFLKRYSISAILGIAGQDDDDGNIATGNEYQQQDKKAPGKPKPKPKGKDEASRPSLEVAKVAYFELLKSTASFPNDKDDVARHAWQKLITKKESTKIWAQGDYDRAMLMLNWRLIAGEESDVLVEYLEKHRTKPKELGDRFLDIMGVGQLTEIEDITHWPIAMSAALQFCNKQEPAALDMGRALLRAAPFEGLLETFLKVCEVDKVSKLTKEQLVEWRGLLEKSIAEWAEVKNVADVDPASILDEPGQGDSA